MLHTVVLLAAAPFVAAASQGGDPQSGEPAAREAPVSFDFQVGGGSIPVQVVAGRLVVSCDLATAANRIPVNLFLEVEGRHGLQLHNRAAAGLRAEAPDGTPRPITMLFPDFSIEVPRRELGDEDLFEEFTKYHSAEIGENSLVGSIGVEILKDWTVTFDLGRGEVRLQAPADVSAGGTAPRTTTSIENDGTVVAPLTLLDDMAWLPVRWNGGEAAGLMLGTSIYDTRIDVRAARAVGKPAGDVGPVKMGNVDLASYVALRPEPVVQVHPDKPLGITGLGLLENLVVTVDRARRELRLKPTGPAKFPDADLVFFRARADEDPDAIVSFLDAHGKTRLAHEAAALLLDYRLQDEAPEDEVRGAVQWMFETMAGDLRTTRMLDLMKEMADAGEPDVVVAAGKLGIEAGRDDRYPNAVHNVHGLLGRTLMDRGDGDDAWRHLLSAAFGLPEDGRINYDLGRFYESQERYRRAYSRYVQAVIKPEAGGEAIDALQRVQEKMVDDGGKAEPFSVDTIERMIAGKVRSFGAASTFTPDDENPAYRTVLCEFFTNGHYGNETRGGAIGGALGFEGMISHFAPEHVVFLEYHLPQPQPDSLCNALGAQRAAEIGVGGPNTIVADGIDGSAGAGKWRDAEKIYSRARTNALGRLAVLGEHEIDATARIEDGKIVGEVIVYGPEELDLGVQVVIAEAGVLYPGTSGVIVHRHVARASALANGIPLPFEPNDDEEMKVDFEFFLEDIELAATDYLEKLERDGVGSAPRISTGMDPNQARVVAYLQDMNTGAVFAACEVTPDGVVSVEEPTGPASKSGEGK